MFHNISLHRDLASSKANGNESLSDVLHQRDSDETITFRAGYFQVPCKSDTRLISRFNEPLHFKAWKNALNAGPHVCPTEGVLEQDLTMIICRYEYANVYWAVMDLYNTFLSVKFLGANISQTHLLIFDTHPNTPLDGMLTGIFKSVRRFHDLDEIVTFSTLGWIFPRRSSPLMSRFSKTIPYMMEFRSTILDAFHIPQNHVKRCNSRKLNVLFIWRRDYVAHPRNPSGIIDRKIKNEEEILNASRKAFPTFNITGVQLDLIPIREQFRAIASSDIFIGMHGAAHAFNFLLPRGSCVVEMFPLGFKINWHMEYIAKWSGNHYISWKNKDKKLEDTKNKYTTIPAYTVVSLLKKASKVVCSGKAAPGPDSEHKKFYFT